MMKFRHGILVLILIVIFNARAGENLCAPINRLNIPNLKLRQELMDNLRKDSIKFELSTNGDICYASISRDEIMKRVISLDLKLRPINRIKIAGGIFATKVLKKLDDAGIDYKYSEENSEGILIIKNNEEIDSAGKIIDSVAKEMFSGKK